MSKRAKKDATAWRNSPEGHRRYVQAKAEAQRASDDTGFDHGLEPNDLFQEWSFRTLPDRRNRYGHELSVEVVSCTDLGRCRPGHGPVAR